MKSTISLLLPPMFIFLANFSGAQNPGNVGTANLTAWFKPDALVLGDVPNWTTTFPTGGGAISVTDGAAPFPLATNTPAQDVSNYNTTVFFDANTTAALKALRNTSNLNLLDNASAAGTGTFFCAYLLPSASPGDHILLYNEAGSDGIQLRNLGVNSRLAIGSTGLGSLNATRNYVESNLPTIVSYKGNRSTPTSMSFFDRGAPSLIPAISGASGTTGLNFGFYPGINSSPYNGYLHEVIFYDVDLSDAEINRVNSYLAIKYGATLLNTGGGTQGDYTATSGSVIWDASTSPNYHNDIIGIGRDDDQALMQKQSHSYDDVTRIYLNTLGTSNGANSGTFSSNLSFAMVGHNGGNMCSSLASNGEIPSGITSCGLYSRLEREWKITKTNVTEDISLDLRLDACAVTGSVDESAFRLLVDSDGDFSNGGTTCYFNGDSFGTVITYADPVITISGISATHFSNNSTLYFTIGSIIASTPLPVELTDFTGSCDGMSTTLNWTTASEFNNDYFTVERSYNMEDYMEVGRISSVGSTDQVNYYSWKDETSSESAYYKLSQTDFDGNKEVFQVKFVQCERLTNMEIYPNPTQNNFTVDVDEQCTLEIYDVSGKIILQQFINNGEHLIEFSDYSSGAYFIQLTTVSGDSEMFKLIKQ